MRFYISNQPPDDTNDNKMVAIAEHRGPTTDRPSESEFQQYSQIIPLCVRVCETVLGGNVSLTSSKFSQKAVR